MKTALIAMAAYLIGFLCGMAVPKWGGYDD